MCGLCSTACGKAVVSRGHIVTAAGNYRKFAGDKIVRAATDGRIVSFRMVGLTATYCGCITACGVFPAASHGCGVSFGTVSLAPAYGGDFSGGSVIPATAYGGHVATVLVSIAATNDAITFNYTVGESAVDDRGHPDGDVPTPAAHDGAIGFGPVSGSALYGGKMAFYLVGAAWGATP